MDFSRAHDRLISFAVSAMITTSFLATAPNPNAVSAAAGPQPAAVMNALEGLRAAGWAGIQNAALPAPALVPQTTPSAPAAAENPPLSIIQIQKLLKLTIDHGHDIALDKYVTAALGLTAPGETLTLPQVSIAVNPQLIRSFEKITSDGGYLFGAGTAASYKAYRTNANLELIAAVQKNTDQAPVAVPIAEAQQQLMIEIAYWGMVADHF